MKFQGFNNETMKEFASNEKNEQRESTLNCSLQKCLQKCLVFKAL